MTKTPPFPAVHGTRTAWPLVLAQKTATTFYRRMVLVERDLHPRASRAGLPKSVEVGPLDVSGELSSIVAFRPGLSRAEATKRVERGDRCFGVRIEGELVHAAWAARGRAWVEYLHRHLALEEGDVYIYDSYTSPALRRGRLAEARNDFVCAYYRQRDYRRSLGLVALENKPGLAVTRALGYRVAGHYCSVGLSRWNYVWSRPLPGKRLPGVFRRI